MLFYIGWKPRAGQGTTESEASLEVFSRWTPPAGLEIKAMYGRADAGGFCICEAESAEALQEAMTPWAGTYLDYDVAPIVEIEKAVEIQNKGIVFRRG
jgi:hypothetical protein